MLAAYRRTDERSAEAGLKYFVLGALASGILLYGISLLYGFTGTTNFAGLAAAFGRGAPSLGLLFGLVFLLAGLAFKISAVPFHMWTPDVYEGAPTPVTAFFASAPKVAAVLLSTRVCLEALGPAIDAWRQIVICAALLSIFLGAIAAFGQTNIKRLLAYSSINNVGFALIGLAGAGPQGASSVLFYMAVYVVMTLGAFLCVLWMRGPDGEEIESIESLSGLSQTRPAFAAAFAIFMFSLAGIPPLVRLLAQADGVPGGGSLRLCRACRGGYPRRGCGRLLLSEDRQGDVHGRAGGAVRPGARAGAGRAHSARGDLGLPARLFADQPTPGPHRPGCGVDLLTRIKIVERTGSTNADLIVDPTVVEGTWLVALEQNAGRGRQGRDWVSAKGNFYGSTLVQLRPDDPPAPTLSLAAGLALIEAIDVATPTQGLMLKWPNDLMLLGKKLAGILLERSGDRIVIGFGVNLASAPQAGGPAVRDARRETDAGSVRAITRRQLRASAAAVADERKLGAGPRLARTRASARHETRRSPRQGRDDQRPLWRARP